MSGSNFLNHRNNIGYNLYDIGVGGDSRTLYIYYLDLVTGFVHIVGFY